MYTRAHIAAALRARVRTRLASLAALYVAFMVPMVAQAQFTGTASLGPLQNLNLLKPPAGARVAIVVFEDLGCPACAHAHPIEQQVAAQHHVPLVRYDFPLPAHIWTFDAAVDARYIQKHVSLQLADQFRSDVFAAQMSITSRDDMQNYFRTWLQRHGQVPPFVVDGDGSLAREVKLDTAVGERLHVNFTPTVIVVNNARQQPVTGTSQSDDINHLAQVVEAALAQTPAAAAAHPAAHKGRR